ncbi:MAG: PQQ-dependent sugar dehydrogenase [Planctomycetota bacterium]
MKRRPVVRNARTHVELLETRRLLAGDATIAGNRCWAYGDPDAQPTLIAVTTHVEALPATASFNPIGVSVADTSTQEGNGTRQLEFTVSLTAPSPGNLSIDVRTVDETATSLQVERIVNGLSEPIYATHAPGDPDSLYVVEQDGVIKRVDLTNNTVQANPFLTVSNLSLNGERGLLGLAFHPEFEINRRLFVYTTDSNRDTLIREYTASADGTTADASTEKPILGFEQPFGNHNGGWIDFGPDGYLYIASGDGGSGNDPLQHGQNPNTLLGAMLRIDVDGDDFPADINRNYSIPQSNPFVGSASGADEVWAYGLRNPWRNSFDRETGDLYIADVGQNVKEEINIQPAGSTGGENYGWRLREGTIATPSVGGATPAGAIDPVYDYNHNSSDTGGFSVTGGYVYRGPIDELQGHYFFADFVTSRVWSFRFNGDAPDEHDGTNFEDFIDWTELMSPDAGSISSIASFGEDAEGNLLLIDRGGEIFRISDGADYASRTQTLAFDTGVQTQTFTVPIIGDRLPEEHETLIVQLFNPVGLNIDDGVAIGTLNNDDAPRVSDVTIRDGDPQRSIVDELIIQFDSIVQVNDANDDLVQITNRDTMEAINSETIVESQEGKSQLRIRFQAGPSVEERNSSLPSLADGNYQLTLNASRVLIGGLTLDGDDDGAAGGDYLFGDQQVDQFFRLFGDLDGDRDVDGRDYGLLSTAIFTSAGDVGFDERFDFDGDGDIDGRDYGQFGRRLFTTLEFV